MFKQNKNKINYLSINAIAIRFKLIISLNSGLLDSCNLKLKITIKIRIYKYYKVRGTKRCAYLPTIARQDTKLASNCF